MSKHDAFRRLDREVLVDNAWHRYCRDRYVQRDGSEGTYYYVDRARQPPGNYDFHLFRGPRGNMKTLPMTNIVSDSEGDIFATKRKPSAVFAIAQKRSSVFAITQKHPSVFATQIFLLQFTSKIRL